MVGILRENKFRTEMDATVTVASDSQAHIGNKLWKIFSYLYLVACLSSYHEKAMKAL